jgi:hypothetical protein
VTIADGEAVVGVGPAPDVLDEDVPALEVAAQARVQAVEALRVEGPVVLAPPDRVLGRGLAHDELVGGGPGGVLAGVDDERAGLGELALGAVKASSYSAAVGRFQ